MLTVVVGVPLLIWSLVWLVQEWPGFVAHRRELRELRRHDSPEKRFADKNPKPFDGSMKNAE